MAFKLGQKPGDPVINAQNNNHNLIEGSNMSMMNRNSPQYKATLNKEPDASSIVGTNPREQLNKQLGIPKSTPPNANVQSIKDNVNTWKSSQAQEKARWNALTDDQKSAEQDKKLAEQQKKLAEQQQVDHDLYNKNFYAGYGGVTTGAANIALGSGEEGEVAGGFVPGVGEAIDFKNTIKDFKKGDYAGAAMNAAGFMLPFVPGKAIKKLFGKAEDAFYPTTVYRQAPTDASIARTSYKGSESAAAKKVREKGDFFTDNYSESEFYGRGDIGNRGIRQGDDITITEAKLPFWMKDSRFDPDVQKLKKAQGGAEAGEYIVPNKGFSSMFIKKREFPVKGLPSHIENVSKGTRPISDQSSFFTHTKPGQYVMDQQKGARSFFGIKE